MTLVVPVALIATVSSDNEDEPDDPTRSVVCPTSSITIAISKSGNDIFCVEYCRRNRKNFC